MMKSEVLVHFPASPVVSDFGRRPKPNKALEPTTHSVTPRAFVPKSECNNRAGHRIPARVAPERVVAHL